MATSIVYLATNRLNGKRYIGVTSKGLAFRQRQHEIAPNAKRVACPAFHSAMAKYGASCFEWMVLAEFETFKEALIAEVDLISQIRPEYNLTSGGQGTSGRKMSPQQLELHRAKSRSPEERERRRQRMKNWRPSPEMTERSRAALKGKKRSAEEVKKILEGRRRAFPESSSKPWLTEGISVRTWFRRRAKLKMENSNV